MKYIDERGTIFSMSLSGVTGYIENGWSFEVVSNNIKNGGELTVKYYKNKDSKRRVSFTFKGVKELKNDLG